MNGTLLDSGIFKGENSIVVHNAPGYQLEFSPLEGQFSFDQNAECSLYGQASNQGLYICVANSGDAILAGESQLSYPLHHC